MMSFNDIPKYFTQVSSLYSSVCTVCVKEKWGWSFSSIIWLKGRNGPLCLLWEVLVPPQGLQLSSLCPSCWQAGHYWLWRMTLPHGYIFLQSGINSYVWLVTNNELSLAFRWAFGYISDPSHIESYHYSASFYLCSYQFFTFDPITWSLTVTLCW